MVTLQTMAAKLNQFFDVSFCQRLSNCLVEFSLLSDQRQPSNSLTSPTSYLHYKTWAFTITSNVITNHLHKPAENKQYKVIFACETCFLYILEIENKPTFKDVIYSQNKF